MRFFSKKGKTILGRTIKNGLSEKQADPLLETSAPACSTFDEFYQSDCGFIGTPAWHNAVLKIFSIIVPVGLGLALLAFAWPLLVVILIYAGARFLFSQIYSGRRKRYV